MNGRTDASTSTDDDLKSRPLFLFYFTHPFGVLSTEPPTLAAAPAHVTRAFVDMQPVSPCDLWGFQSTSEPPRNAFDIGNTTLHRNPLQLRSVNPPSNIKMNFSSRDSTSSLFPSETWLSSSSSSEYTRRLVPHNRILPPLQLPSKVLSSQDSSDDFWPVKCLNPEKFSLPPIEIQCSNDKNVERSVLLEVCNRQRPSGDVCDGWSGWQQQTRSRSRGGVRRARSRPRRGAVNHMVTSLIRRAVKQRQECSPSAALQHVLSTIREAWTEPATLRDRCRKLKRIRTGACSSTSVTCEGDISTDKNDTMVRETDKMASRTQVSELPPRAGVSPGLLRRRYSMPETIMRKYRLEQQRSECSSSCGASVAPAVPACGARCRDHMRRSALLRRLWGRGASPASPSPSPTSPSASPCVSPTCCHSRSLHTSRSELRHLQPSPRHSPSTSGWASPKRQRLGAPHDSREDMLRAALGNSVRVDSDSTYRPSSSYVDTESTPLYNEPFNTSTQSVRSEASTVEMDYVIPAESSAHLVTDSFSESDQITSVVTALETSPEKADEQIAGNVSENCQNNDDNDDKNLVVYESIQVNTPAYDVLEIVVSETQEGCVPAIKTSSPDKPYHPAVTFKIGQNIDIDEYVSHILVESLNSLTDQLESMNASIDRKISIVEKEIKVKLQNTGVNTIVHLSPTSNNQIIFGNEELCNRDERDVCNNRQEMECLTIREEAPSVESNNNVVLEEQTGEEMTSMQHDVKGAVLQQIQKLFQEEMQEMSPHVSHVGIVEVSNVDMYIDNMEGSQCTLATEAIELQTDGRMDSSGAISGVGTGNYYQMSEEPLVARYCAFPHTESMEVNTSSDDALSATSLVDSLEDPHSPRAPLRRHHARRHDLVRSAIDVLDLLPEHYPLPREKGEAYFVRIDDDDPDCDKENIIVADHMPEKIKQKLYRRHRKRELRMECARRTRVKQLRRELERQRREDLSRSKREIEKECMAIINAMIDDVIAKIVQDEYKCMRIKQRSNKSVTKSDEVVKRKNDSIRGSQSRITKNDEDNEYRRERQRIHGKLSLRRPDVRARRIYQKSEIHEGDKCIEILEILEYGNTSSSPETNSDECRAKKKSRIPIPLKCCPPKCAERRELSSGGVVGGAGEGRARSNSLRFRRVFDVIPEERALGGDSGDEAALLRRASAPSLALLQTQAPNRIESSTRTVATSPPHEHKVNRDTMTSPARRSAATSPLQSASTTSQPSSSVTHSPQQSSAVVHSSQQSSSVKHSSQQSSTQSSRLSSRGRAWLALPKNDSRPNPTSLRSVSTQYSPIDKRTVRTIDTEKSEPIIVRGDKRKHDEKRKQTKRRSKDSNENVVRKTDKRRIRVISVEKSEEEVRGETRRQGEGEGSSSSESSGSLLCALAPRWLSGRHRRDATNTNTQTQLNHNGSWSVTVAGSCPDVAPRDLEMRLRFPQATHEAHADRVASSMLSYGDNEQECSCNCVECVRPRERRTRLRHAPPPAPPAPRDHAPPPSHAPRLALTLKKEASDSSIVASKSRQKSSDALPHLDSYRASHSNTKTSLKTRRACSLHCWLPDRLDDAPIRESNGLSVLGCAIVPELKPRVRTMSERDVTRLYTPRLYLRS